MRKEQSEVMRALHVRPTISPAVEIETRLDFLVDYLRASGANGYVLGISGGQDSALAGRLCQLAVERLRDSGYDATFIAMRLPYGKQLDAEDVEDALDFIAPDEIMTIDISESVDSLTYAASDTLGHKTSDFNKGNVKARVRMVAQFAVAGDRRMLVAGSDHAAEAVTGFYTKYGDGAADVMPLVGLTKRQGAALARQLGCPPHLYEKTPTADLLDDKPAEPDEVALGVTYAQIDDFLEGHEVEDRVARTIMAHYRASQHKRQLPASPDATWWRKTAEGDSDG